jgi:hypothetical protein
MVSGSGQSPRTMMEQSRKGRIIVRVGPDRIQQVVWNLPAKPLDGEKLVAVPGQWIGCPTLPGTLI